eukprot:Mrub_06600.p1 GENE.Mrub_06600~~Mrub_06600.p1  ORF type:complete len:313 (+),score=123.82 Mrub_06600:83-940(+)
MNDQVSNVFQNDPGVNLNANNPNVLNANANSNANANANTINAGGVRNKTVRQKAQQAQQQATNNAGNVNAQAVNPQLIGEYNADEFMAKLMTGVGVLIKEKVNVLEEQMADHEEVIQEQIDQQNLVIEQVNVTVANINATINDLRHQITYLQKQNLQIADARGPTRDKNRILHCTGWALDNTGHPLKPEANNETFAKLYEVVEKVEHTGGDDFILYTNAQYTYWAAGKAIALHWNQIRAVMPHLDIRSRRERGRNADIGASRFHTCTKGWEAAKYGNKSTRLGNF